MPEIESVFESENVQTWTITVQPAASFLPAATRCAATTAWDRSWRNGPRNDSAAIANVRVVARQQWTPDLAEEIAAAESVLFVDSSVESAPGRVSLIPVDVAARTAQRLGDTPS